MIINLKVRLLSNQACAVTTETVSLRPRRFNIFRTLRRHGCAARANHVSHSPITATRAPVTNTHAQVPQALENSPALPKPGARCTTAPATI